MVLREANRAGEAAAAPGAASSRTAAELFVLFAPALVMFALTMFSGRIMVDGDPFMHIAAGQWMIDQGEVIREDPFSYTFAGQPWHPHEWLSEILMALTYSAGGVSGLFLLAGLAFGATAMLLARELLKHMEPVPALYLCLFALGALIEWIMMRPHVLVMPILAVWAGELLAARKESRAPHWFLIPLMVLWVNLHPSFLFGVALIAVFAFEAVLESPREARHVAVSWGRSFLGVLLATLINPAGVAGATFPIAFTLAGEASLIGEWRSMMFEGFGLFEAALLAGVTVCLLLGVRMTLIRLLLLVGMLHLALEHRRFAMVLAIVGALILAGPIASALKARGWTTAGSGVAVNTRAPIAVALLLGLLIAAASFAIPRGIRNEAISPIEALAHVPREIIDKPVFNDWLNGGYLMLTGRGRVFIDGRAELYGRDFIANYLRIVSADVSALTATFEKHGVVWTLLPPQIRATGTLDLLPGWCRLYADGAAVVHVRRDALPGGQASCRPSQSAE